MCGIFGFKINNRFNTDLIIQKMSNVILHRGPDSQGSFKGTKYAIGINRLKIIDLITGDQPINSFNNQYIIVFNGEIYNYIELKKELTDKGYIFKTKTDTEVVVNIYQEHGIDGITKLNGMFAFAIVNLIDNEIIIARDRFGVKPLFYYYKNNNFIFGSEIKSIVEHPDIDKKIDFKSTDFYMTMESIPAPFTIYKDIKKLEPGNLIKLKKNNLIINKWYNKSFLPKIKKYKKNEIIKKTDYLLKEAVKKNSISDVPIGTFLSGGIDSSLISYYLSKISNSNIKTFNIGFDDKSFDESDNAKIISKHINSDHHQLILDQKILINSIDEIYNNLDEPFSDPSLIPTYHLSKFTRKHVKVAMSGDGGDEIFGGYPTYLARSIRSKIPNSILKTLNYIVKKMPTNFEYLSLDYKLKKFLSNSDVNEDIRHLYWLGAFNKLQKQQLYKNKDLKDNLSSNFFENYINNFISVSNLKNNWERSLFLDNRFYLTDNNLTKTDTASMLNSLEVRVPFLDNDLFEYIARLPMNLKYKGFQSKFLLRNINKKYLPKSIAKMAKKGLGVPIAKWINEELYEKISDTLLSDRFYNLNYFNKDYIIKIMNDHKNRKHNNRKEIWTIFCFAIWNLNNQS